MKSFCRVHDDCGQGQYCKFSLCGHVQTVAPSNTTIVGIVMCVVIVAVLSLIAWLTFRTSKNRTESDALIRHIESNQANEPITPISVISADLVSYLPYGTIETPPPQFEGPPDYNVASLSS